MLLSVHYTKRQKGKRNLLNSIFPKDNMPQKLQHPPTLRIALLRLDNPLSKPFVITQRPSEHLIPRHRKLRTARSPHQPRRHLLLPPLLLLRLPLSTTRPRKHVRPYFRRNMRIVPMCFQTTRVPVTAQVHVAGFLYKGYLEGAQRVDVVVEGGVGVPGGEEAGAVGVEEYEDGWEVGVVVDYVGEIGH